MIPKWVWWTAGIGGGGIVLYKLVSANAQSATSNQTQLVPVPVYNAVDSGMALPLPSNGTGSSTGVGVPTNGAMPDIKGNTAALLNQQQSDNTALASQNASNSLQTELAGLWTALKASGKIQGALEISPTASGGVQIWQPGALGPRGVTNIMTDSIRTIQQLASESASAGKYIQTDILNRQAATIESKLSSIVLQNASKTLPH